MTKNEKGSGDQKKKKKKKKKVEEEEKTDGCQVHMT